MEVASSEDFIAFTLENKASKIEISTDDDTNLYKSNESDTYSQSSGDNSTIISISSTTTQSNAIKSERNSEGYDTSTSGVEERKQWKILSKLKYKLKRMEKYRERKENEMRRTKRQLNKISIDLCKWYRSFGFVYTIHKQEGNFDKAKIMREYLKTQRNGNA